MTLAYSAGILTLSANFKYYNELITTLANTVTTKCNAVPRINASGVIINTCGFIKDAGYTALCKIAKAFKIDVVIVLENEWLVSMLQKDLPPFVKVFGAPKSGGVETRASNQKIASRKEVIRKVSFCYMFKFKKIKFKRYLFLFFQYFYGNRSAVQHPFVIEFSYAKSNETLLIAKVGTDKLPDSCLPVGVTVEDHRTKVVKMQVTADLKNHVLAVMPPNAVIDQSLIQMPVLGFVVVTEVDTSRKTFTILSPQPQPLPSNIALYTDIIYVDDS